MDKNICIVSQAPVGHTETFIKAHLNRIEGNVYHLYGYYLRYSENGISLREKYKPKKRVWERFLNIFPHYFVYRRNQKIKNNYSDFNLTKKYLTENKIDIILAEYGITGSFITPVCKALNIPLIVHFHGFDASRYDILNQFQEQYKEMFEYTSAIIVVSQRMLEGLKTMGCPEKKLVYNPYGPNPIYFQVKPDYDSNHIIAIGRQTFKKAPYLTILAFAKVLNEIPDLVLHFVGDGEIMEISKNLVKALGIEQHVVFHGVQPPQKIVDLMNQSFMFVQHSIIAANGDSEGTPVAVLEAMAAGLPVVATKHAGISDVVVENGTGYLVDEGDIDQMAEYIINVAADRALAEKLGKKGKERIAGEFTLSKHLEVINKTIQDATK